MMEGRLLTKEETETVDAFIEGYMKRVIEETRNLRLLREKLWANSHEEPVPEGYGLAKPCRIWNKRHHEYDYGSCSATFLFGRKKESAAHRVSYTAFVDHIPAGGHHYICHRCDTPGCIEPTHLYLGNAASNGVDRQNRTKPHPYVHRGYSEFLIRHALTAKGRNSAEIARVIGIGPDGMPVGISSWVIDEIRQTAIEQLQSIAETPYEQQ